MNTDESPLPRSAFDSENLPDNERFAVWRESLSPLFAPSITGEPKVFFAQLEAVDLKNVVFVSTEFSTQQFHRSKRLCKKDQMDHVVLQLYTQGGYIGYNGKNELQMQAGDICVLDLGYEMHTQAQASHNISLVIPRDMWKQQFNQHCQQSLVLSGKTPMGFILGEHLKNIWKAAKLATQNEVNKLNEILLSVAGQCLEAGYERFEESDKIMAQATLKAIEHYIQANLCNSELSPEKICCAFHCSRSYLYRLFEPLGGVSCQIQKHRLEKCYQVLISEDGKNHQIAEIAFSCGFNSQSHFSRLFRKVYGISPKQARDLGQDLRQAAELLAQNRTEDSKNIPEYRQWFLQI